MQQYFRSPVNYNFLLAGNFGELRSTHFHAGLDIKPSSENATDKIYCVADGYIHRIVVRPNGYGRAIYVVHPDAGYTTVYAHLDEFEKEIEEYTRNVQKARSSYTVDFNLPKTLFKIQKGKVLGVMGNTGRSYGTHLHFEIRETATEKPINPFLFGLKPADNIPPDIHGISVHGLDTDIQKKEVQKISPDILNRKVSHFIPMIDMASSEIGIAIEATDRMNGANNKNGVYRVRMYVDDSLYYYFQMDKMSFGESNQIAGFIDFPLKIMQGLSYMLCYKLPGISIDLLKHNGNGIINLSRGGIRLICIEAEDFDGNVSEAEFYVKHIQSSVMEEELPFLKRVKMGEKSVLESGNCRVVINERSLFRDISYCLDSLVDSNGNKSFRIHQETEPVKNSIEIGIRPDSVSQMFKSKMIITKTDQKGEYINYGGKWQAEWMVAPARTFGDFQVIVDTIPPTIKAVSFKSKKPTSGKFTFSVKDNLETAGSARELNYKVWIDNKLIICPYKSLTYVLEVPLKNVKSGLHKLKIEATDHSGNKGVFTGSFIKK
ncbi:MAG: peptidoglycan DD-metalloendopeptidase family protein [Saprospiraceae bacterium]|nr:peptidoglycan DD-metalloendopeptidase family protein [Saprospiraceae bacterium]